MPTLPELRAMGTAISGRVKAHHVVLSAAGVAFFGFVALIPALAAVLAVYGLVSDPQTAADQMERLFDSLPDDASELLTRQVSTITESSSGSLSVTLVVSLALSLWAASSGMAHLVEAVNMVHDRDERRGWLARRGLALALTLGATVAAVVALFVITAVPRLMNRWLSGGGWLATVAVWVVVGLALVAGLSVLYRVAPERRENGRGLVTVGGVVGVLTWAVGSVAFSVYVGNFGSYNETYGSLAAVVVLLLWLFLSAFVVLLAGEVDAVVDDRRRGGPPADSARFAAPEKG